MQIFHNEFPLSKHDYHGTLEYGVETTFLIKESGAVCVIDLGERWFFLDRSNNLFIAEALRVANALLRINFLELLLMCYPCIEYWSGYHVFHDLVLDSGDN